MGDVDVALLQVPSFLPQGCGRKRKPQLAPPIGMVREGKATLV